MIYDHITVEMPTAKRVTKYEKTHSKPYVYEIIKRKSKDNPKDVTVCVGVATEDGKMHPNDKYFEIHPEVEIEKPENLERVFDDQIHLGASFLLRSAADKVGLSKALKDNFPGYEELILTLAEYYMMEKESAAQLYKYYLYDHYTKLNYIPSESTLSRFYNDYLTHENIKKFLNSWMKDKVSTISGSMIDIDFDSTNFNVNSKGVESAEYGKAKEDEGLPQVNVAYFLDRKTGLPLYYDIYCGSIIDMEHCQTAIDKIREIDTKAEISIVMDRGYFSSSNLKYFNDKKHKFMCMGKKTEVFNKFVITTPASKMQKTKNWIYGTLYGIKRKGPAFSDGGTGYYLYYYYDSSKAAVEMPALLEQAKYAQKFVIGKRDKRGFIRNTYHNLLNMETDDKDVIVSAELNTQYLDKAREFCGYFWIVSNENLTPEEVISSYRHRDAVEKTFKGIKTDSDLNKLYASTDSVFEAKSLIAFITAILRAEITMRLKPYFIQYCNETSQTVLKEADKIKAEQMGTKYVLKQALTSRQKQIISFYEGNLNTVREYIDSINERQKTV